MHTCRPIEESKRILEERLVWSLLGLGFVLELLFCLLMVTVLLVLQAKAQRQRDRIQEEKTYRSRMITEKVPPPTIHTHTHTHTNADSHSLRSERPERVVMLAHGSVVRQWKADCSEQKC